MTKVFLKVYIGFLFGCILNFPEGTKGRMHPDIFIFLISNFEFKNAMNMYNRVKLQWTEYL